MKFNKNKRIFLALYAAAMSTVMLTGFESPVSAEEQSAAVSEAANEKSEETSSEWAVSQMVAEAPVDMIENAKTAAEEAERIAREQAEAEAAAQAAAAAQQADKELLASLIFCEAGNQPYEGQVAVGAVVLNRINSAAYPNTMEEVIYQSGQFSPAMSGWLDRVRANGSYTDAAMQAAEDALAGSNPVGNCLYFSVGGYGMRIGDHLFH